MNNTRRNFLRSVSMLSAATVVPLSSFTFNPKAKLKLVLVGTGVRGSSFWGKRLVDEYSDILEFVGLCDINPGRLEYAKKYIGTSCPTFANFTEMINQTKPDSGNCYHHRFHSS